MTRYMISDGHGLYIRKDVSGNYIPVKNKSLGDVWKQQEKASNILMNSINKNLRNRYKVVEIEFEPITKHKISTTNKIEPAVQSGNDLTKRICEDLIEENSLSDLLVNIDGFAGFVHSAEQRRETLTNALSDVDKEICDINHYIEFGKFNAYQGWFAFNMLRGRLKRRRKIKDELYILNQLGECKVNSAMLEDIKESIDKLSARRYQPRKLNELFKCQGA